MRANSLTNLGVALDYNVASDYDKVLVLSEIASEIEELAPHANEIATIVANLPDVLTVQEAADIINNLTVSVTTLEPGSTATSELVGTEIRLGIPAGVQGVQGIQGPKGDKGDKGDSGLTGAQGPIGLVGPQGPRGLPGSDGKDGVGVTITSVLNNIDKSLTINFSDGTQHTTDPLKGQDGRSVTITNVINNANGTMLINFSDGTSHHTADLRGPRGFKGDTGDHVHHISYKRSKDPLGNEVGPVGPGRPGYDDTYAMWLSQEELPEMYIGEFTVHNGLNTLTAEEQAKLDSVEFGATTDQEAFEVPYDNSLSGLLSVDVQNSIDELAATKLNLIEKGQPNGVATLDSNGLVPSTQLPSYVDDVIEAGTKIDLPIVGEKGKIYIVVNDESSNGDTSTYRWTGTVYAMVSNALNASDVKALYEANPNTNAYTDDEKSRVDIGTVLTTTAQTLPTAVNELDSRVADIEDNTTLAEYGITDAYTKTEVQETLPAVGLDTTNTVAPTRPGQIKWNQDEGTADLALNNGVTLQIGQENTRLVSNATSNVIPDMTVCMFDGTIGNSGRIKVAPFTGLFNQAHYVYGIATQSISAGEDGYITIDGKVRNVNTTGTTVGEVWVDGDILYAKPNDAGRLTKVTPADNELRMPIASVVHAHVNGTLEVRVLPFNENMIAKRANKWATARTITLNGDVAGSVSIDGSADATITTTVQPNSVNLGTDTTGNYMVNVRAGSGISVSHTQGEGSTATITNSAPNVTTNITTTHTSTDVVVNSSDGTDGTINSATQTLAGVMSAADKTKLDGIEAGATGDQTASEILTLLKTVDGSGSGLDADLLNGQEGAYYLNASNINAGTIDDARLPDTITSSVTGNAATATKLATARTIRLTGDVTGSVSFDGSTNASITAVVADDSHNHTIANITGLQAALDNKVDDSEKGVANGIATLDTNGKVVLTQIPDSVLGQLEYMGTWDLTTFPTATQKGQYWIASVSGNGYVVGDWAVWNGTAFDKVDNTDAVATVAGRTGNVVLTKSDVGLDNVDNTADSTKNVLSATKLTTARTISLTGGVSGSAAFDGSSNITLEATVANDSHTHSFANLTSKPTTLQGYGINPEELPASINLDTKTITGLYSQSYNSKATLELNYPVARAGLLEVLASSSMIHQQYWAYNSSNVYYRAKYSRNAWTPWTKGANVDNTVAAATKLATARTINGVAFDGTVDIVAPTDLGITAGTTAGPIVTSSTGTNATLPTASESASGVVTTGAQTIAGVKTFMSSPIVPTPTAGTQAVNKGYADTKQSKSEIAYDVDTSSYIPNTLPSGAIIERGSNANGAYTKYADGTLICIDNSLAFTSNVGGNYIYFPASFINTSYCMNIVYLASSRTVAVTFTYNPINKEYAHVFANVDGSLGIGYIAIGRWK